MWLFKKEKSQEYTKEILLNRLGSEVEYLRDQNTKLVDRLLAVFDSKTYVEVKQFEARENFQKVEKERVQKMTAAEIAIEKKKQQEDLQKQKILNMQLSQMTSGGDGSDVQ